jgi:hypothetical protein
MSDATKKKYELTVKGKTSKYANLKYNPPLGDLRPEAYEWHKSIDGTEIDVSVEKCNPEITGELSWEVEKEKAEINMTQADPSARNELQAIGTIIIPSSASEKFRVVVKEYEAYITDSDEFRRLDFTSDTSNEMLFKINTIGPHNLFSKVGRLVFFDIVDLDF